MDKLSRGEIDRIIASADRMARRMNARFVVDPVKMAAFPSGRDWLDNPAGRRALNGGGDGE